MDIILTGAVQFLEASDAFPACCVCREWHQILCNGDREALAKLWKQVCINTHPISTKAILAEAGQPNVDFRALCGSLRRGLPVEAVPTQPTLNLEEDVFAIVELYRRTRVEGKRRLTVVGSWTCRPVGLEESLRLEIIPEERVVVKGKNQYHESPPTRPQFTGPGFNYEWYCNLRAFQSTVHDAVDRAKVVLFRRDNMKSVCIMDEEVTTVGKEGDAVVANFDGSNNLIFDSNEAGQSTLRMMYRNEYSRFSFDGRVKLSVCDGDDQRAASAMSHMKFEVSSFSFRFLKMHEYRLDSFESLDDLSVALEGLCWR